MGWGTKIAILYIGFVLLILTMVLKSMTHTVDLVSTDYYEQELKFQEKINGTKNTDSLHLVFKTEARNNMVSITYPEQWLGRTITGKILFYRHSDSALDLSCSADQNDKGTQVFASGKFRRGSYKMLCDFVVDGKKFCYEENLFMN
jgi:hypothetical protein